MIARSQAEHAQINVREFPGTRQLCVKCGEPTERCEEDALYANNGDGPFCQDCCTQVDAALAKPDAPMGAKGSDK